MNFDLNIPSPYFEGSTGGWLSSAEIEEKYAITWTSPKEQNFEMPTGGSASMRLGENLVYFARKEQCLALGTQLRTFKISDYKIYRLSPTCEIQYLYPKDGVFSEKSNVGRIQVNNKNFSIGKNPNPIKVKFTGKQTFDD